jgi:hypothetical protein
MTTKLLEIMGCAPARVHECKQYRSRRDSRPANFQLETSDGDGTTLLSERDTGAGSAEDISSVNDFVSVSLEQIPEQISDGICPGEARHERLFVRRLERARDIPSTSSWEVTHCSRTARSDSSIAKR